MNPGIPPIATGNSAGSRPISPTDVSQFIRLDQCQRFLRLRLLQHADRSGFRDLMEQYDANVQRIPALLTRSGADFELAVEVEVRERFSRVMTFEEKYPDSSDNEAIVELLDELPPGEAQIVFQPRLQAMLDGWRLRGDVDIIRFERSASGVLSILIADMKSSSAAKVEHRLQVAFYHRMLASILAEAGVEHRDIDLAILYRGPAILPNADAARAELASQRQAARETFGVQSGYLERVSDAAAYLDAVRDLVTGPQSLARRIVATDPLDLPFHLTARCDGCVFNQFCLRQVAIADDLSVLPYLSEGDKTALQRHGIRTTRDLASLKELQRHGTVAIDGEQHPDIRLVAAAGREQVARDLASTWPVGPHLDEVIHRARRYRKSKHEPVDALDWIPGKGYGSLPYSDAHQNPNLVTIFLDVQRDYLHDRVYLLGALVTGRQDGVVRRQESVVRLAAAPPTTHEIEAEVVAGWVSATVEAITRVACPDADGAPKAPIHLVFHDALAQQYLLDALARHATTVLGTTALYDLVTQVAAFDSSLVTQLDMQIRQRQNYPMVCQSLQSVATFLGFKWNEGVPYRRLFQRQVFDYIGKLDSPADPDEPANVNWITTRARFGSQLPLEYAYAAWDDLPPPDPGRADDVADYRAATPDLLTGFHARRLEAIQYIAGKLRPNRQTSLTPFDLTGLGTFSGKASTLADAIAEFVTIERHVELADWKQQCHAAPEQRMLAGQTLVVRYAEADQLPGIAERNRENERRRILREEQRTIWKAEHPDAKQVRLPKDQSAASAWNFDDMIYRLRIEPEGTGSGLDDILARTTMRDGSYLVLAPRTTVDTRLPPDERMPFTPTPKQVLWGLRANLQRFVVERQDGRVVKAWVDVTLRPERGAGKHDPQGYIFGTIAANNLPLEPEATYTLDPDPGNRNALWAAIVSRGLVAGGENTVARIIGGSDRPQPAWPDAFVAGQERFMLGLDALRAAGLLHGFEDSKREFIGGHANSGLLMVQGPPGTGKSYSTAFALLARLQGALAADHEMRILLSCKTHAAIDVLIDNLTSVRHNLETIARSHPGLYDQWFDRRLLSVPIYRYRGKAVQPGVVAVPKDDDRETGDPPAWARFQADRWCVIGATPGGIYGLVKTSHKDGIFGHTLVQCLVLDEASQMNLPEAILAGLPLAPDGNLIVVGDHRQMPPIIKNDWANERRRTFSEFRTYESVYLTLMAQHPPRIGFAESFRLHADMAEFLRREIYRYDGIDYHSNQRDEIDHIEHGDSFLTAVLDPKHPLVVIVHDEAASQMTNVFEQEVMAPILSVLAEPSGLNLSPDSGLGVVVPHRAQRAALVDRVRAVSIRNPETGEIEVSAVDTVERFQGRERTVMLFGATESDRDYLLVAGDFLLDPRRLNVALSRAKRKMILVASRSVFDLFSADEETFANAQLWKNLLRHTCTVPLWQGERHGHHVEVWGNRAISTEERHT